MADNNWKHKEDMAVKCKEKLQDPTNQLSKTQYETDNTYYEHHLKTGTSTESLVSKPDLAFPSLHFFSLS